MNTKKHIINVAIAATAGLGAIYVSFLISALYRGYFNVPLNVSVILWAILAMGIIFDLLLLTKTKKMNRKIKFFDFSESGYPVDMEHNDEQEWRLMLTATYISSRLTINYLIIAFIIPYIIILFGTGFGLIFWIIFSGTALFIAMMINEWGYVFAYLHLDRS
ncbi:hypothetical protein QUF07_11810 [Lentilactobacillus sp. TOM.63]|uniref:hypothetical protein n=1 Tax=Lentilactobacillus sp. TOM.63 TaxID=3055077 RepID=UPI0025A1F2FE|nr:hypothetical protein [Lentilactobacillus sp. TOM.63]MDM7517387.1 hypothetical protein [Lentilactobacillus sp. TOM.63]